MIRATTPTHIFNLPFETSTIKELMISYAQRRNVVIEKFKDDCVFDGKMIALTLTQRDTLKFSDRRPVEIQLRVVTTSDTALAGDITEIEIGRVLDGDVMGSDPKKLPTGIIGDSDAIDSCCCNFDVDFKELYIVETESSFPEGYEGEYGVEGEPFVFIPSVDDRIVIPTGKKYVPNDIVIEKISYTAVSNESDGLTVTIG